MAFENIVGKEENASSHNLLLRLLCVLPFQRPTITATATVCKIKPLPKQTLVFTCLQDMSFENTVEKGEIT